MDKKLVLAVAGSGKTTEIINRINYSDKTIIITYTDNNYENIKNRIIKKFNEIPKNIRIYTYFTFLYKFCFAPLKKNQEINGIEYNPITNRYLSANNLNYYMNLNNKKMYHSRLAKLCKEELIQDIYDRLEKYFDNIYIDEIQDFSGHDFNFLLSLIKCNCNIFLVGDFFQHTYDTSRDGSVNKNLYNYYSKYISKFKTSIPELSIDNTEFIKSKRCSKEVCLFIKDYLGIEIESFFEHSSQVKEIHEKSEIDEIMDSDDIIKLFYQNSKKYNIKNADNWGNSKGSTFENVCVVLNEKSYKLFKRNKLLDLPAITRNKLYVACSRPTKNLYIINEKEIKNYLK